MGKSLLMMIAAGVLIGLMLPSGHQAPGASAVASVTAATANVAAAVPASTAAPAPSPRETRLARMESGHFYADPSINGQPVHVVIDTGASFVALTKADAQRIGIPFSESEFQVVGTGASGPVRGKLVELDRIDLDGKEVRHVRAAVLEGLDISLLGQAYLSRIGGVQMSGDEMVLR
jgi:aspartyl protease family protein